MAEEMNKENVIGWAEYFGKSKTDTEPLGFALALGVFGSSNLQNLFWKTYYDEFSKDKKKREDD